MTIANAANQNIKTVGDPNAQYETLAPIWKKCRAVCSGEKYVKELDTLVDVLAFSNLLIPFSPTMSQMQYNFYRAEAELPGITAQFSRMLIGGLLRKLPIIKLPEGTPEEVYNWIKNEFAADDSPLISFLDEALWEEIQTNRAWVFIDYPKVEDPDSLSKEDLAKLKPYPILYKAESVINWTKDSTAQGKNQLKRVIIRGFTEEFTEKSEFHPVMTETVWVHELDGAGYYQIRIYKVKAPTSDARVIVGVTQTKVNQELFELVDTITNIEVAGNRLQFVPAWPLNGRIDPIEPMLSSIVDKEISLYNKISRRNHLLYGAATYTPVISADISDDQFDEIVNGGLGTWIHLPENGKADVLKTPTEALADMDRAIAASIEEMAKLGIRMLSPETDQSGIALEIRNASQTAQLGTLNSRVSSTLKQVISFMITWRYGIFLDPNQVEVVLSEDFSPVPIGADWLRLATEWYQQGLIPRSIWLRLLKQNDMIDSDYDDEKGKEEIIKDQEMVFKQQNEQYAQELETQDKFKGE